MTRDFFQYLILSSMLGNSGRLTWKDTAATRASLPIGTSVCSIFVCLVFGTFKVCTDVDTRDCTHKDDIRESALEVDCERKIPRSTGDSKPRQYCAWLFSRTVTN